MTATRARARSARIDAKRIAVLMLGVPALAVLTLVGCGGTDEPAVGDSVEIVRASIEGFGTTQSVRCDDAGELDVRGLAVVRCEFEEEEDVSGVMRAKDRCYVVESGVVVDVTRELPVGTSCTVSGP